MGSIEFLYGTAVGRAVLNLSLNAGLAKVMAAYLNSPLSRHRIPRFIRQNQIDMSSYEKEDYRSFGEFFGRKKAELKIDMAPDHLVSPCDGLLSSFTIHSDSSFQIKGSSYRVCDLVDDADLAKHFDGGLCLIYRLTAADYHHYIMVDDAQVGKQNFREGKLHSVQPIACDTYPVYRINRRNWCLFRTDHFGEILQIEVGAMAVGGIANIRENCTVKKGEEYGHFELCGSTIVQFVTKDAVKLLPAFAEKTDTAEEQRIQIGMWIATKA